LGEVAVAALGQAEKAQKLYELNKDVLKPKVTLPVGAQVKVPQRNSPGLAAFGLLVLLLLVVGLGWLFKSQPIQGGEATDRKTLES
jgi:hypothetical protein